MNTLALSRRTVLRTLLFSAIGASNSRLFAGGVLVRSSMINWIDGCFMPRQNSISFESAKFNALKTIRENQRTSEGNQIVFTYISDLPDGSTVEDFLSNKQTQNILTLQTKTFEGMGSFIEKLNGVSHNPSENVFWKFKVNGIASQSGISQIKINTGDVISFILGSALNDQIRFVDSLGDYSKTLVSDVIPLWDGKPLTQNDWPYEGGSVWYEFCCIEAPYEHYFFPNQIQCTKYIERWDASNQVWTIISTVPVSTSAIDFIGQSWNDTQESSFDQVSTLMHFGGVGTGFSPLQGSTELARLNNRLAWLQSGKIRIRTKIQVELHGLNGTSQTVMSEKFSLKKEVPFTENEQPLQILSPQETLFTAPTGKEGLLYEIETSSDLQNWNSNTFMSGQTSKHVPLPQKSRWFQRVRRF